MQAVDNKSISIYIYNFRYFFQKEISYQKALKMIEVQDYIARNVTQKYEHKMAVNNNFEDVNEKANKSHEETKQALKEMDTKYDTVHIQLN